MKRTLTLVTCVLALSALSAFAGDKGEKVEVKDLPAAVSQSVTTKWPASTITNAKKLEDGTYRLRVKSDKELYVAIVAADGTIKNSKEKEKGSKDKDE